MNPTIRSEAVPSKGPGHSAPGTTNASAQFCFSGEFSDLLGPLEKTPKDDTVRFPAAKETEEDKPRSEGVAVPYFWQTAALVPVTPQPSLSPEAQRVAPEFISPAPSDGAELPTTVAPSDVDPKAATAIEAAGKSVPQTEGTAGQKPLILFPPQVLGAPETPLEGQIPAENAAKAAGMTAAQEKQMVFQSQKQDKIAEPAEQNLPVEFSATDLGGEQDYSAFEPELSPAWGRETFGNGELREGKDAFEGMIQIKSDRHERHLESAPETAETGSVDVPKLVDSISSQVRIHAQSDRTIEVLLKPDGQTELLVQMKKVDGEILVQVRCERGDFSALSQQWNAIQQSLATQGIKVEPLEHAAMTGQFDSQEKAFRQDPNTPDDQITPAWNRGKRATEPENTPLNFRTLGTDHGWQSWA